MKTVKKQIAWAFLVPALFGLQSASIAYAKPTITYWHKEWKPGAADSTFSGECVTVTETDASASTPTSAPSYGITFHTEMYNGDLIAADTYLLDSAGRKVKQVGHADLEPPSRTDAQQSYASDSSSPFSFSMTDAGDGQITLEQDALFSGDSLEELPLRCLGLSGSH
jgi:hypothetical protein